MAAVHAWEPGGGLRQVGDGQWPLLAADSWLVDDGRVRGLDLHHRRFAAACAEVGGVSYMDVDAFWVAVIGLLPREGAWFPRVELADHDGGARLVARIRPAPPRTSEATVWVAPAGDPRRHPHRKGPDLDRLGKLRAEALATGANEALLTAADGSVLEAANSSLLWWDDDELCVPDPALPVLAGVTRQLIEKHAAQLGIGVRRQRVPLAALANREAWLTNALHGIRPVVAWHGTDVPAGGAGRVAGWRGWWDALAEPLP